MSRTRNITLRSVALLLAGLALWTCASSAGQPLKKPPAATSAAPGCDFEAPNAWKAWTLQPPEPRQTSEAGWETLQMDFLAPSSGQAVVRLFLIGAGRLRFDNLELYRLQKRKPATTERRAILNPGFEAAVPKRSARPEGWITGSGAVRSTDKACTGKAALLLHLSRPGSAAARQELRLKKGGRYRLTVRVSGEVTAGLAGCALLPEEGAKTILAGQTLNGSTLLGGRGRCGRLTAEKGNTRLASIELDAAAGQNYTLQSFFRGDLGDRGRLRVEVTALSGSGEENLLAARALTRNDLGPDWRPLRFNFALREARRLRLRLRLDGPALVELDDISLRPPLVVPAPKRFTASDAGGNFRPKGRRPLITSNGKKDAQLVQAFTSLVGKRVRLPTAFWQFWRSGRAFDHQSKPFTELLERKIEDGSVLLLDVSRKAEAKWLAGRAIIVPDQPGSYAISVRAKALIVAARGTDGFMAAASALGWLSVDGPEPEIFGCQLEDWPTHNLRGAEISFDGRLAATDRQLVSMLGTYRMGDLVVTGSGFWRLPDSKTRAEARDILSLASRLNLRTTIFLDALGSAPALAEKSPQSVEMAWKQDESHYLRGTERSFLGTRNVVSAAGAPVEVTSERGRTYVAGKDYHLEIPSPRLDSPANDAPRSWMRRLRTGRIPDGGRVLLSYNALPPATEVLASCPRAAEALDAYRKQLEHLSATGTIHGVGIGGRLPKRMRSDRRTAGTRFKNGRLVADRVRELVATTSLGAPKAEVYFWGDLLNPCGGLGLPEDSPAASAELIDPALRKKLTILVRLSRSDPLGLDCTARSTRYLLSRGYDTVGWCGTNGAAARAWAVEFARWRKGLSAWVKTRKERPGRARGMVFSPRGARLLELERFAQAAWCGVTLPDEPKATP